jgi:hypothetical protein
MIKIGLIPPRGLEAYALRSDLHMVLASPSAINNSEYYDTYANDTTKFKILDNGANEDGKAVSDNSLLSYASLLPADEIVLPDVMGNKDRTVNAVDRFLDVNRTEALKYSCMAVLHAPTVRQAINTARYWSENRLISTIGIPRIAAKHQANVRIEIATELHARFNERFQIHFLGSVVMWPTEIRAVVKYAPFVRSMDTSLPFNFTIGRTDLEKWPRQVLPRPANYFIKDFGGIDKKLLEHNIETFKGWARGA